MRRTPRGAWIRDLTVGAGAEVASGTQVAIHYVGTLPDGTQFDANGPADQPFVFRTGAGEVVPGFDEGVLGMKVGGRRQVIIPPALGYGAQGNGPVPGNAILVFTIDLVRAQ
jgi:peptidylprolyl isomerase